MPLHRHALPQLEDTLFLTDGGLETTLVFHDGIELPCFAAFTLLDSEDGRERLRRYFRTYAEVAAAHGTGMILESATWRASPDWAQALGYSAADLDRMNRTAIGELVALRDELDDEVGPLVVSGCVGPRGDGYAPEALLDVETATDYHAAQIASFAATEADLVTAMTMTHVEEAAGIARAARAAGLPVVISFTVETDGCLPSGEPLGDAILRTDAETDAAPAYYMLNCAHPTHFDAVLRPGSAWVRRVRGLRANASACSHAELDAATELDMGDPADLARRYRKLRGVLPHLNVLGGCCGTDHRHVAAILAACAAVPAARAVC